MRSEDAPPHLDSLRACRLCPRRCAVDRSAGRTGFCRAGRQAEVFRHGPHHGEEPVLSGTRGSGTVFFSRCTLQCLYCQNYPWSQQGRGEVRSTRALAGILRALARAGCHNWNMVSPTPWLPMIREAVAAAKKAGDALPLVYNTSGFEEPAVLAEYSDCADVYLTDLRYASAAGAAEGSGRADYAALARDALLAMWELAGPLKTDAAGLAVSGLICRVLVLPNREQEAVANLRWLARTVGTEVSISLMSQYRPLHRAAATPGWDRALTAGEYEAVSAELERLGFANGWVQALRGEPAGELVGARMPPGGAT